MIKNFFNNFLSFLPVIIITFISLFIIRIVIPILAENVLQLKNYVFPTPAEYAYFPIIFLCFSLLFNQKIGSKKNIKDFIGFFVLFHFFELSTIAISLIIFFNIEKIKIFIMEKLKNEKTTNTQTTNYYQPQNQYQQSQYNTGQS